MAVSTPSTKTEVLKSLIDEIFAQRRITRQVQHELMQILLSRASLSQQEKALANQVFEAIQQGRLRIVDYSREAKGLTTQQSPMRFPRREESKMK